MRNNTSDRLVVLVTGASSGAGLATARLLAQQGHRVLGTSRNPAAAPAAPGVEMLALDVRDDASVAACVEAAVARAGRIDVLVNNAGYELAGALEEVSLEEARAQFETNFFGTCRMVKAVLPLMRRQGGGRIINISSLAGIAPVPFMGMYSATKFALEGYTEALRYELRPFNVQVSQVEPGFLNTPMKHNRVAAAEPVSAYDAWRRRALAAARDFEEKGPGGELVAQAVHEAIAARAPRLRYVIGKQAKLTARLKRYLPAAAFEMGVRRSFGLDAKD